MSRRRARNANFRFRISPFLVLPIQSPFQRMSHPVDPPPQKILSSRSTVLATLSLILVPLLIFTPSVLHDHFVNWDDEGQLYQNPDFNPPTFQTVIKYWHTPHMNLYMP